MSTPVEGGRPLLRIRLFGFPVHLDLSFVLIMAFLGYGSAASSQYYSLGTFMAVWLLITPFAVLVHELGHAIVARAVGARPQIALAGFGGVTTFVPPRPLSRAWSLAISLAGPMVGLLVGLVLIVVRSLVGTSIQPYSWQDLALAIGIFTCIAWSVLNLLPVLPLDGGQAMRELLPGAPEVRARRAAVVSVVTAIAAAVACFLVLQQPFVALFMAFFAVSNIVSLRQDSAATGERQSAATPEQAVVALLWQGQIVQARQYLENLPEGAPVDLAVHGAVLALTGDRQQGYALLAQEVQRRPGDANAVALLLLAQVLGHDWDAVLASLQGPLGASVPHAVVERAIAEAQGAGRQDVAGRLTLLAAGRSSS